MKASTRELWEHEIRKQMDRPFVIQKRYGITWALDVRGDWTSDVGKAARYPKAQALLLAYVLDADTREHLAFSGMAENEPGLGRPCKYTKQVLDLLDCTSIN